MLAAATYDLSKLVATHQQLSRVLDEYEFACNILDATDLQPSPIPESTLQTLVSIIEKERDIWLNKHL